MAIAFCLPTGDASAQVADKSFEQAARAAIRRASAFYSQKAALHGGYVYYYSPDLQKRLGEGPALPTQVWVQPPGTPTVGLAFLAAYDATGDRDCLLAGRDAARVLVYGQFRNGGWTNAIDTLALQQGYRYAGGKQRRDGNASLDDGQTQSALMLLMQADKALKFQDDAIHRAARGGLDALLAAQFPSGAFPQVWKGPTAKPPAVRANYPTHDWRTEGRIKNYWDMATLNDNVCGYVAETLMMADQVYGDAKYRESLKRLGEFLLLAQMPAPQPAWCQQYNHQMQPIWARKFEPPAIAADESQEVIATLMKISRATGNAKYLQPIPAAIEYLRASRLPDGQLARYYQLQTNEPLYMGRRGKKYFLTNSDADLPKHYGWKWPSRLDALEAEYESLKKSLGKPVPRDEPASVSAAEVARIIEQLDEQGRWISIYAGEPLVGQPKFTIGEPYLSSAVFSENLTKLSIYIAAHSP